MISRHRFVCPYASVGGSPPPGMIGAVPATWTCGPTRTAREKPITGSNGDPEVTRRRSMAGLVSRPVDALRQVDGWAVGRVAGGVTRAAAVVAIRGAHDEPLPLASVTKLVTTLAALVASEEGIVDLDEPAGPPGAPGRPPLAHASGLPLEGERPIARPGTRRIYSNTAFAVLGELVAERAEMSFTEYARAAVA